MKPFPGSKFSRLDLFLLLLAIGLSIFVYYSPGIRMGHMDWKGTVDGSSSKETVFVLPAVSLFIYFLFNFFEKHPSLLIKPDYYEGNDEDRSVTSPKTLANTLFFWKVLKLLSLCSIDCVLLVSYFPKIRWVIIVVLGLFMIYNISFLFRSLRQTK